MYTQNIPDIERQPVRYQPWKTETDIKTFYINSKKDESNVSDYIIKETDTGRCIEVALPGFTLDEIELTESREGISLKAHKKDNDRHVLCEVDFIFTFTCETEEISNARLKNGILFIETKKSKKNKKTIKING